MKVRGSLAITKDLILSETGGTAAIEGKVLYVGPNGIVVLEDLNVSEVEDRAYPKKGSLVFDTDSTTIYFSIIANADGSILSDETQWSVFSNGQIGAPGEESTGLEKIGEGNIISYVGALSAAFGVFSIAQVSGDVSIEFLAGKTVFFDAFAAVTTIDATYDGTNTIVTVGVLIPGGSTTIGYNDVNLQQGWRLKGMNPAFFGNIGANAVDFSNSSGASTNRGSTGLRAITFGSDNINPYTDSLMMGEGNTGSTDSDGNSSNIISGWKNELFNTIYDSIIQGERNIIGIAVTNTNTSVVYNSMIAGALNTVRSSRSSFILGAGLTSGAGGVTIVGVANVDITINNADRYSDHLTLPNPRFIVGVGKVNTSNGSPVIYDRANGFVVMHNGTVFFPNLSIAKVDASSDDSAVTKGWVQTKFNDAAYTDAENVFTEIQEIKDGAEGAKLKLGINGVDIKAELQLFEDAFNIQITDNNGLNPVNVAVDANDKIFYIIGLDIGSDTSRAKELFLSEYANALGYKTVENDPNKVLFSDGSVKTIVTPESVTNTGTVIDLTNHTGTWKTDIVNATTIYTILAGNVTGGYETRLINAASEPTVTGAVKIKGSDFVVSTNMYMITFDNGTVIEYYFTEI